MKWTRTSFGLVAERTGGPSAEFLVAIIGGAGASPNLLDAADAWAAALPFGAFVVFEAEGDIPIRITRSLAGLPIPSGRQLLVGIGKGGGLCIDRAVEVPAACTGVLVYDPPAALATAAAALDRRVKVRLVGLGSDDPDRERLPGLLVQRLRSLGIDARATQLRERRLVGPAVRIGTAYLAELSAAALDPPKPFYRPSTAVKLGD
ncbi:hypothetical protein GCM10011611_13990 [Aliidongia dinghuensis]|uniref:Uncharacterized protein n=1 Tax=Aliidongia dinghuensis TaxID=1867774 RepID=A0A8J2YRZ0_9PROT|nr:hypothetical protein [Aliidongia dinghuensis]GGF09684.1 hypothetical protein GCM10011611_13990 [Aliidongia dinghuensis]